MKLLEMEKPNLNITLRNVKTSVDVNPEVYSREQCDEVNYIVGKMAENIYLDRTYVSFKGNRWKDSFLVEDKWYDLMKLVIATDGGREGPKEGKETIKNAFMVISLAYLYNIAEKYGYDADDIEISVAYTKKFKLEYEYDPRTSWNS